MDFRSFFGRSHRTPLHSGAAFERRVADWLATLRYKGHAFEVEATAAAGHGIDIPTTWNGLRVGWESKRANAFEAGGRKMKIIDGKLGVHEDGLLKDLLGQTPVFNGEVPRFLVETVAEWSQEEADRFRDVKYSVDSHAAAAYYAAKETHYIVVEGRGIYHTGIDILELGVPKFVCDLKLRIRTSKHKTHRLPDGTRVPTDVVVDLNYNPRTLPVSPVQLFTPFPEE
jgi:hypothetical protein